MPMTEFESAVLIELRRISAALEALVHASSVTGVRVVLPLHDATDPFFVVLPAAPATKVEVTG